MLSVSRTATDVEIKTAYRKLALQYHPDRNPDKPEAEEMFKEASEAYSVLADVDKRSAYDRFGHAAVSGAGGPAGFDPTIFEGFGDIFGEIFGFADMFGGAAGGRRNRAQRGGDLREDLDLEFDEAVAGAKKTVKTRRRETCETCEGSGAEPGKSAATCRACEGRGQVRYQQGFFSISRTCPECRGAGQLIKDPCKTCKGEGRAMRTRELEVKVPAGVEDGTRIRYSEQGESGVHGGPPGDLYIILHVKEHAFFERDGKDLYCVVPISFTQATLGAQLAVPTLDGEHTLKVPDGTQSGTRFRLRGKGVPAVSGHGRGDIFVEVRVQTPAKLSKRQRELLEELDSLTQVDNKPQRRSLFSRVKDIFA